MPAVSPFPNHPKVAIVGSGAIGGYFGACLAKSGVADVHFLLRSDYDVVKREGYRIQRRHAEDFHIQPVQAYKSPEDIGPVDLVLIALKGTANDALPALVEPLIHDGTVLLTLQNGLGNVEFLEEHFGNGRALGGLVFIGLNREAPGTIRNFVKSGGYLTIGEPTGPVTDRVEVIARLLNTAEVDCRTTDHLQEALWKKLVWNVPFNGLTIAGGGITTDQVLQSPPLRQLGVALMGELQEAAGKLGILIDDKFIERQYPFTEPMGAYKPSSLVDFLAGKEVEVEAIFGEPLRKGEAAGADMPHLRTLYALLHRLCGEGWRRARDEDRTPEQAG